MQASFSLSVFSVFAISFSLLRYPIWLATLAATSARLKVKSRQIYLSSWSACLLRFSSRRRKPLSKPKKNRVDRTAHAIPLNRIRVGGPRNLRRRRGSVRHRPHLRVANHQARTRRRSLAQGLLFLGQTCVLQVTDFEPSGLRIPSTGPMPVDDLLLTTNLR